MIDPGKEEAMDEEILKWKRKHPEAVRASMANPANYWNLPNKGFVYLSVFYPILVVETKTVKFKTKKSVRLSHHTIFRDFYPYLRPIYSTPSPKCG